MKALKVLGLALVGILSLIVYLIVGGLMVYAIVAGLGLSLPVREPVSDLLFLIWLLGPALLFYGIVSLLPPARAAKPDTPPEADQPKENKTDKDN